MLEAIGGKRTRLPPNKRLQSPLFTELPRRGLPGNRTSGIPHSRTVGFRHAQFSYSRENSGACEEPGLTASALFATISIFRRRCFGYQEEFAQRALELGVRFFGRDAPGEDRGVIALFGPHDSLGDVGVGVALGPITVDVQFHQLTLALLGSS